MNIHARMCVRAAALVWMLAAYGASLFAADEADKELSAKMNQVIIAEEFQAEGTLADEQFCDVLQKLSKHYAGQWKEPLPILIDFEALQHLRASTVDFNKVMRIRLSNIPLPEYLQYGCGLAGLKYSISHGAVLIKVHEVRD